MGAKARQKRAKAREEMWLRLAQQPGTHLVWESRRWWGGGCELSTAEQQAIASCRVSFRSVFADPVTVSAGGMSFINKKLFVDVGWPRQWPPGVLEIARLPEGSGQKVTSAVRARLESLRQIVDETGTPVLYTYGIHYAGRADTCITFPDRRWLEFPVWGRFKADAIMTAVDQDGNEVAEYRAPGRVRDTVEITVHPDWKLTDELVLVIAISAGWLHPYFAAHA